MRAHTTANKAVPLPVAHGTVASQHQPNPHAISAFVQALQPDDRIGITWARGGWVVAYIAASGFTEAITAYIASAYGYPTNPRGAIIGVDITSIINDLALSRPEPQQEFVLA